MAYTINNFDGTVLTTVADGTIDTTATNIKLVGKNYTGYGEILNENYVWMLQNFASSTEPTTPLTGQIWWNTSTGTLTVYDGSQFKAVSSSTVSTTEPTGAVEGDLWWSSDDEQLYVYSGTEWILIGPAFSASAGQSGAVVEVIQDTGLTDHVIVTTYVSDVAITITSKDATFTPNVPITDFGDIYPGVTLVSDAGAVPGARFTGTATNAGLLGAISAGQFLRADIDTLGLGTLTVQNDGGIAIGFSAVTGQLTILTGTSESIRAYNQGLGGNLLIGATNAGGTEVTAFDFNPDTLEISANSNNITDVLDPTAAQHAATKAYVDSLTGITGGTASVLADGTVAMTGVLVPTGDGVLDLGSVANTFDTVHAVTFEGESTSALYADMAERFEADAQLEAGTVVMLGGAKEICAAYEDLSDEVFGVVSTKPAHLMNSAAGTNETHPPIAMAGRVPVRVVGEVRKGNRLVSAGNGLARAATKDELTAWNVIGRALEDKYSEGTGVVEAIVSMKS